MATASGIVRHIQRLLKNPENWLQKSYARDKDDNKVVPSMDGACKFCLIGALHRSKVDLGFSILDTPYQQAFRSMNAVARLRGFKSIMDFNDNESTTHDAVTELLEIAEVQAAIVEKN